MKTKLLCRILALLGFSAVITTGCGTEEYGSPWAEYKFKGRVTDDAGVPLEGMRVVYKYPEKGPDGHGNYNIRPDTVYTNISGEYLIEGGNVSRVIGTIQIRAEETKEFDGKYDPDIKTLEIAGSDYKGSSGEWYDGRVTKTTNFVLSPVESADETK